MLNKKISVEVCAGNIQSVNNAYKAGADRIELVSQAHHGGLTPSMGLVLHALRTNLEVVAMVRPRIGGFNYSNDEVDLMFEEATILLETGVSGIVFGFLNNDFTIDIINTEKMVKLIKKYNKTAIFHRAIDLVTDQFSAFEQLIDLKVDRILTSGGMINVDLGLNQIKKLNELYGNKIEIIAGGGVNINNAIKLINDAGISQLHATFKTFGKDITTKTSKMSFSYNDLGDYDYSDDTKIVSFINKIKDGI